MCNGVEKIGLHDGVKFCWLEYNVVISVCMVILFGVVEEELLFAMLLQWVHC